MAGVGSGRSGRVGESADNWGAVCSGDDLINLEPWSEVKLSEDVVSIRPEMGGVKQGFCSRRADLIQAMRSNMVYKWILPLTGQGIGQPDMRVSYYKHPDSGVWLDERALEALERTHPRKYSLFQLKFVKDEPVGTAFGASQLHGAIMPIYTLVRLASAKDYLDQIRYGRVEWYRRDSYERKAKERKPNETYAQARARSREVAAREAKERGRVWNELEEKKRLSRERRAAPARQRQEEEEAAQERERFRQASLSRQRGRSLERRNSIGRRQEAALLQSPTLPPSSSFEPITHSDLVALARTEDVASRHYVLIEAGEAGGSRTPGKITEVAHRSIDASDARFKIDANGLILGIRWIPARMGWIYVEEQSNQIFQLRIFHLVEQPTGAALPPAIPSPMAPLSSVARPITYSDLAELYRTDDDSDRDSRPYVIVEVGEGGMRTSGRIRLVLPYSTRVDRVGHVWFQRDDNGSTIVARWLPTRMWWVDVNNSDFKFQMFERQAEAALPPAIPSPVAVVNPMARPASPAHSIDRPAASRSRNSRSRNGTGTLSEYAFDSRNSWSRDAASRSRSRSGTLSGSASDSGNSRAASPRRLLGVSPAAAAVAAVAVRARLLPVARLRDPTKFARIHGHRVRMRNTVTGENTDGELRSFENNTVIIRIQSGVAQRYQYKSLSKTWSRENQAYKLYLLTDHPSA
jgi:hypothetical protein